MPTGLAAAVDPEKIDRARTPAIAFFQSARGAVTP